MYTTIYDLSMGTEKAYHCSGLRFISDEFLVTEGEGQSYYLLRNTYIHIICYLLTNHGLVFSEKGVTHIPLPLTTLS